MIYIELGSEDQVSVTLGENFNGVNDKGLPKN